MPFKEHLPLDPECPVVRDWQYRFDNDPITIASGCGDEIGAGFERRHRKDCARCQEFGVANIEIMEGGP